MAVKTQKLRKNIEGFTDSSGLFHPIRSGEKEKGARYLPGLAGDHDDVFDREIRKEKNRKKADEIFERREIESALKSALGDAAKQSLSQFVRASGGIFFDKKYDDPYNGELENLSFKQSKVKGLAHPKGKKSLDGMREAADLAGYANLNGHPLTTINDFLDALDKDLKGKKVYPFGTIGAYKFNPSNRPRNKEMLRKQQQHLDRVIRKLQKVKGTTTKVAKLKRVKETILRLIRMQTPATGKLKKNFAPISLLAEAGVAATSAVALYDRFTKEKKPVRAKKIGRSYVGLQDNPKPRKKATAKKKNPHGLLYEGGKTVHHRNLEKFLVAIEKGDLSKKTEQLARIQAKAAGYDANDTSMMIQYSRLAHGLSKFDWNQGKKLKGNPAILTQAESFLKTNGIIGRALARRKAGALYKRQLRLKAAIDRAKARQAKAEAKALKSNAGKIAKQFRKANAYQVAKRNASTLWNGEKYKGFWIVRAGNGTISVRATEKGKVLWSGSTKTEARNFINKKTVKKNGYVDPHLLQAMRKIAAAGNKLSGKKLTQRERWHISDNPMWINFDGETASLTTAGRKIVAVKPKKNPVRSKAFEAFQGRKPTRQFEAPSPLGAPKTLYTIGKLLELRLRGKQNIDFSRVTTGKTFWICADERNKQLWIVGGAVAEPKSSIKQGFSEPYAEITHVVYETKKNHLGDTGQQGYIHRFGEEGGEEPVLAFDAQGFPIIVGGSYEITPLGIAD